MISILDNVMFSVPASVPLAEELASSGLFDEAHYSSQAGIESLRHPFGVIGHYLEIGAQQGLSPHPLFDSQFFLANSPFENSEQLPPLIVYLRSTGVEGFQPHPLFDARYYLDVHRDLSACAASINPLKHYIKYGATEGRNPHALFDTHFYLSQLSQSDLRPSNPLVHYCSFGYKQGLSPHQLFDPKYYAAQFPEIAASGKNPLIHFLTNEKVNEISAHPLFDPQFYLKQLAPEERAYCRNAITHFLSTAQGRVSSPHPCFDATQYVTDHPELAGGQIHQFMHYLVDGCWEGRNPSKYFNVEWYLSRKPSLRARRINPLSDYVSLPPEERPAPHPFYDHVSYLDYTHAQLQPSWVAEAPCPEVALAQIPMFGVDLASKAGVEVLPWDTALDKMLSLAAEPFTHLFIIPGLIRAGAEQAACSYIKYCQKLHGIENVLVILADYVEHSARHWLPEQTRLIDARVLMPGAYQPTDMALLLSAFLVRKCPQVTHVVNSYSAMTALSFYKDVISSRSTYVVYLFGYETYKNDDHFLLRTPSMNGALRWADCIITDTVKLADTINDIVPTRQLEGKPTVTSYLTSEHINSILNSNRNGTDKDRPDAKDIFWASRVIQSKRPDLLAEIAKRLPDTNFVVYGSCDADHSGEGPHFLELLRNIKNISFGGEFSEFGSLDLSNFAGLLYTSEADGIPFILLEAAAAGMPIIAPKVGGITEFLSDESAWIADPFDDVASYVVAVRSLLSQPDLALAKRNKAREILLAQHSQATFTKRLQELARYF